MTRSISEILSDVRRYSDLNDHEALLRISEELEAMNTKETLAEAAFVKGMCLWLRLDYVNSLQTYTHALRLFEELENDDGVARTSGNLGTLYFSIADYDKAVLFYGKALEISEDKSDHVSVARLVGNLGIVYNAIGEYSTAISYLHRALTFNESANDQRGIAIVAGNLGMSYTNAGDMPRAFEYLYKSLLMHEINEDHKGVAIVHGNLAGVLCATGRYPEALEHYHKAVELFEEQGNDLGAATFTTGIGLVYFEMQDYVAALNYINKALKVQLLYGDRSGAARNTGRLAVTYQTLGEHSTALDHYLRAVEMLNAIGETAESLRFQCNMLSLLIVLGRHHEAASLLSKLDMAAGISPTTIIARECARADLQEERGDHDSAIISLREALRECIALQLRPNEAHIHKRLRDLAFKRNDLASYVEHNNEYTRITEEINGKETATKLAMQAKQREIDAERREHEKHMAVLHSTLPKHIADRVAVGEVVNDHFDNAAVLFLDVVGFTTFSAKLEPAAVVKLLQQIFTTFDAICAEHNVMKIKTIGDSYMVVAFPSERHALDIVEVAFLFQQQEFHWPNNGERVVFRIGIHCGPLVAGVIGTERLQYDVWGDTVNVASRMESSGEPGRIHVSEAFALLLTPGPSHLRERGADSPFPIPYSLRERGAFEIKGKGLMTTYWLEGAA